MFRSVNRVRRTATHYWFPLVIMSLVLVLASSIAAGTQTAAQDEGLNNTCAPELLESLPGPEYQCGPGPLVKHEHLWKTELLDADDGAVVSLIGDRDMLYVATSTGDIHAIGVSDGAVRWSSTDLGFPPDRMLRPLVMDDHALYWVSSLDYESYHLHAISKDDGHVLWTKSDTTWSRDDTPWIVSSSHESLFVTHDDGLLVVDAATGETMWSFQTAARPLGPIAVTPQFTYVPVNSGATMTVQAIDNATHAEVWRSVIGTPDSTIVADVLVFDGRLYVAESHLTSISATNGQDVRIDNDSTACIWTTLTVSGQEVVCEDRLIAWTPGGLWFMDVGVQYLEHGLPRYESQFTFWGSSTPSSHIALIGDAMFFAESNTGNISAYGVAELDDSASASLEPGELGIGVTARIAGGDTVLHGAPSTTSTEIIQLPEGTELEVVNGPLEEGGDTWWQVKDLASGYTGYVPASQLAVVLD